MATNYLYANPGQLIKIATQTLLDGYSRADGYVPVITSVILPDSTSSTGYPIEMTKISTGLYSISIQIPTGYSALGSYIVSVYWQDILNKAVWDLYVINVARPFGASAASPF